MVLLEPPLTVICYEQLLTLEHIADVLERTYSAYDHDLDIVYEQFMVAPSVAPRLSWNTLPAPRVIGVIEEFCQRKDIEPFKYLPANKRFFTDRLMKQMGAKWNGSPHAVDAARHAFYHAWFTLSYKTDPHVIKVLHRYVQGES